MATYYVDFTTGSDSDTGLTPDLAWKNISKVNSFNDGPGFAAGDQILFKRGELWELDNTGGLGSFNSSGTKANPIIIGAYGTGDRPMIAGAIIAPDSWVDQVVVGGQTGNTVWKQTFGGADATRKPTMATEEDRVRLNFVPWDTNIATTINTDSSTHTWTVGSYTVDDNDCYVETSGDEDPFDADVRVSWTDTDKLTSGIRIRNATYVTMQDLHITGWKASGILLSENDDTAINGMVVKRCRIDNCFEQGIGSRYDVGPPDSGVTDWLVEGCDINGCGWSGIAMTNAITGSILSNDIDDCCWGGNFMALSVNSTGSRFPHVRVAYNKAHDTVASFVGDGGNGIQADDGGNNTIIEYNITYNNLDGIAANSNSDCIIRYNISRDNADKGIISTADNTQIYNNIVYNNDIGIALKGASADDNIVKNNITLENTSLELEVFANQAATAILDNNCYYNTSVANFMSWGGVAKNWATYLTDSSQDINSINADPQFVDATNDDFHLKKGSPCRNAGVDVGLTQDYDGKQVHQPADIGAYEIQGKLTPMNFIKYRR